MIDRGFLKYKDFYDITTLQSMSKAAKGLKSAENQVLKTIANGNVKTREL